MFQVRTILHLKSVYGWLLNIYYTIESTDAIEVPDIFGALALPGSDHNTSSSQRGSKSYFRLLEALYLAIP